MSNKNTGKDYEIFVQSLYQAIIQSESIKLPGHKNIDVEINKYILDKNGIERQFDIYWEYTLADITYKTVIECKDYKSKISIEKIDSFIGKISDIPGLRGLFASKNGYQSGAQTKAQQHNIELLIIRNQNESDWTDSDGNPLLKKILFNATAISPAMIISFDLLLPKDATPKESIGGMENEITIHHYDTDKKYTISDLKNMLLACHESQYGQFEKEENFPGKIITSTDEIEIVGYKVKYEILEPSTESWTLDFSEKLKGVVEYLNKGTKSLVFDDSVKKRTY
ncbi:restriction endonuclease [Acinetobacter bereziniae]|uniref:restriction endonuclease n=1 Tax=Acinetobacter bereziniae TaxID=106648 RepID=UPI0021CD8517|nr:restriction endonuclease [Acinetobacter bereziniae]MCU4539652.1 restriction endonuclease [Acinetobacter bereziniae]MCU4624169.1 restriction endonuclease [Acinetobacter bereziniae]